MAKTIEQVDAQVQAVSLTTDQSIRYFDMLGIAASSICLVHCLAMPFVITFLPLLGWQFLEGKLAHQILAAFVFSFALFGIVPGYLKHHKRTILVGMLIGLGLVLVATCLCGFILPEKAELPLITVGNIVLVITHWHNHHLSSCNHHDC
jgi:hypothetical protein